jgi:hypothetical protein
MCYLASTTGTPLGQLRGTSAYWQVSDWTWVVVAYLRMIPRKRAVEFGECLCSITYKVVTPISIWHLTEEKGGARKNIHLSEGSQASSVRPSD